MIAEGTLGSVDSIGVDGELDDDVSSQILCDAALVALVATRLVSTWHAGAMTAEEAMGALLETVSAVSSSRAGPRPYTKEGWPPPRGVGPGSPGGHRHRSVV